MVEMQQQNYYLGIYYFEFPKDSPLLHTFGPFGLGGNILTQVWAENQTGRPTGPVDWVIHQRFRYYKNDKIGFDSEDLINQQAYRGFDKTVEQIEKEVHTILQILSMTAASPSGARYESISLNCQGGEEILDKFEKANKPWMHIRKLSKEEAEAKGWKQD